MFLGPFLNGGVGLSLSGLTAGTTYSVVFDLFIGGPWSGNDFSYGNDDWTLSAATDVSQTLVLTNFSNWNGTWQRYSDAGPGNFAAFTGADVVRNTGDPHTSYAIYYFGHGSGNPTPSFTATGATATLEFYGRAANGAFWAVDNVVVAAPDETISAVPEPGSLTLMGLGAFGLVGSAVRRRRRQPI
jgi:hypothetical protein